MFTNISWGNYTVVVVLLLLSWYLYIGLRFYFAELKAILTGIQKFQFRRSDNTRNPETESNSGNQESPDNHSSQSHSTVSNQTFQEINIVIEKMRNVVADAAQRKLSKQELVDYLGIVLREYPSVKTSPYSSSVIELIVSECELLELISLTPEEAEALWDEKN